MILMAGCFKLTDGPFVCNKGYGFVDELHNCQLLKKAPYHVVSCGIFFIHRWAPCNN